jgi:hypothetical protein
MTQAEHIIHLLGGVRRASEIVGAPLTTVAAWRDSGFIPARRQAGVIEAAGRVGIRVTPEDFFPPHDSAEPTRAAQHAQAGA